LVSVLAHVLECVVIMLGEGSGVELHVLRLFRHFDDLGERRLALTHVRRPYVVLGAAAPGRILGLCK
jgi:hypothetical protein